MICANMRGRKEQIMDWNNMDWNNKQEVLEAVKQDGRALRFASAELKNDKEFVLEAVKQKGYALRFASAELRNDKDVVLEAVKQDGDALEYASAKLKNDKTLNLLAKFDSFRTAPDIFRSLDLSVFDESEQNNKILDAFLDKTKIMMQQGFKNNNEYVTECKNKIKEVKEVLAEKQPEYSEKQQADEPRLASERQRKADFDEALGQLGKGIGE